MLHLRPCRNLPLGPACTLLYSQLTAVYGTYTLFDFATNPTQAQLADCSVIIVEGSDYLANEMFAWLGNSGRTALENIVAEGIPVFINSAPNEGTGGNLGFGATLVYSDPSTLQPSVTVTDPTLLAGPFPTTTNAYTGTSFAHAVIDTGGSGTPLITGAAGVVLAQVATGVLVGGMTTTNFHLPDPSANNLRQNIYANYFCPTASKPSAMPSSTPSTMPSIRSKKGNSKGNSKKKKNKGTTASKGKNF